MKRDISDTGLRRAAAAMGFKGANLPLRIADLVSHPKVPAPTLLQYPNERRRDAVERLRLWIERWSK